MPDKKTKRSALDEYEDKIASDRQDAVTEAILAANTMCERIKHSAREIQDHRTSNVKFLYAMKDMYDFIDRCNDFLDEFDKKTDYSILNGKMSYAGGGDGC